MEPRFLTFEEVLEAHEASLREHGGAAGIRDGGALASALAFPQAGIGERYFHPTIREMAAAYAFHICRSHAFVDGNKRAALLAALTFLELNGYQVDDPEGKLHGAMIDVASGKGSKAALAVLFESLARPTR